MKKFILKYKIIFIKALFLISISSIFQLSFDFFKGFLLDLAVSKREGLIYLVGLLYLSFVFLKAGSHYFYTRTYNKGKSLVIKDLREAFVKGGLGMSYIEYKNNDSGYYINKYSNEFPLVDQLLFQSTYSMLQTLTELGFALLGFFIINKWLAALSLFLIGASIAIPFLIRSWISKKNADMLGSMSNHTSRVKNYMEGHEIIHNFMAFEKINEKFMNSNQDYRDKKSEYARSIMAGQYLSKAFGQFSILAIMGLSIYLIRQGAISIGKGITAMSILISVQSMTSYIATNVQNVLTSRVAISSIMDLVDFKTQETIGWRRIKSIDRIQYKNAGFSFQDKKILDHFNLDVNEKGTYLIQGRSGSGKSTLMNILLKYYNLDQGLLLINDYQIDEIERLNPKISIMRQEVSFFQASLRENLRVYNEDIGDEEIYGLLKKLNLEKFANKEELDRLVVNNGDSFSGGERRRFGLIRSLLKKSDVLILDEPFANLDEESIKEIAKRINEIDKRIVFLISHQVPKDYRLKVTKVIELGNDEE